ncbi:MAG: sporulation protein YqfD [Clostridia bacterium]|nr:sporulation protein YqfD [Clostridia bacterium]
MRWYSYLVGYLIVIIEGQFPEKVINMALTRGIFLWDIVEIGNNKIRMKVRLHAFRPLARIARACSCRARVYERRGMPFQIKKVRKRKSLALGSILFFLSLYILTSFVWVIEVKGTEDLTTDEIKNLAGQWGLKPGAVIKKLDIDKIERAMLDSHPQLAWVGINIQGIKATIEISEKVLIPKTDESQFAHLVAKEGGQIKEMLVLVGTPLVKEGDMVEKGQILIEGYVYPEIILNPDGTYSPAGEPKPVRAKGIVRAEVKYSGQNTCELLETGIIKTGEKVQQVVLKIGKKQFILQGPKSSPYSYYDQETLTKEIPSWRNIKLPVELITNIYWEEKRLVREYGPEGAYREAIRRAEEEIKGVLADDAKILQKSARIISADDERITVEVIWQCLENIAVPQLLPNVGTQ